MGMQVGWLCFLFQLCKCDPNGFQLPLLYETQVLYQQHFKRKKWHFSTITSFPPMNFETKEKEIF
jgi:hypothetical protein